VNRQHAHIFQQRVSRRIADAALGLEGDGPERALHGFEDALGGTGIVRAMKA